VGAGGQTAAVLERLRDPDARKHIHRDIEIGGSVDWENLAAAAGTWENILVTETGSGQAEGETIATIAAERGTEPVGSVPCSSRRPST
jgi:N-acyl-D-amino-acid deacylase